MFFGKFSVVDEERINTLRELILARTNFGEFDGLVEFSFQFSLVMWPSAKLSSRQNKFS